jgi:hypothetical protein
MAGHNIHNKFLNISGKGGYFYENDTNQTHSKQGVDTHQTGVQDSQKNLSLDKSTVTFSYGGRGRMVVSRICRCAKG